jgi:molybdenum cofactor cytidylyltransferase
MSAASNRYIGVILAAGRGRRMGRTKQLVSWPTSAGDVPLIVAAYEAIQPNCNDMVVVLGSEAEEVAAALGNRQFTRITGNSEAPMFESIRIGICAALKIDPTATIVLQPGDHPDVAPSTLKILADWSRQRPGQAIIPEYRGRGGHPVLIPPAIAAMLIDADCPTGLGEFWTTHPELCWRVPVDDAGVLRDIDTLEDLAHPTSVRPPRHLTPDT